MSIFNNFSDFMIEVCIGTAFDCEENEIKRRRDNSCWNSDKTIYK